MRLKIYLKKWSSDLVTDSQIKISVDIAWRTCNSLKNIIWHMDGALRLTLKVMMEENPKYHSLPRCLSTPLSIRLGSSLKIIDHGLKFNWENACILRWIMNYSFRIWILIAHHQNPTPATVLIMMLSRPMMIAQRVVFGFPFFSTVDGCSNKRLGKAVIYLKDTIKVTQERQSYSFLRYF